MLTSDPTFGRSPLRKPLPATDVSAAEAGIEVGQCYRADENVLGVRKGEVVIVVAIVGARESSEFGTPVFWEAICYRSDENVARLGTYYFICNFTHIED
jgi:hypothetical protein